MSNPNSKKEVQAQINHDSLVNPVESVFSGMYSKCSFTRKSCDILNWTPSEVIKFMQGKGFHG